MWMSDARSCTASVMINCTSRTTGALLSSTSSSPASASCIVSVKSMAVSVNSWSIESALSPTVWP